MQDKIRIENNSIILNINPKIYPLEIVYSAAYVFLDKSYILLDGDPEKEISIRLKPKEGQDLEKLGNEFLNELINYADYKKRAEDTKTIRETLLQRALITNDPAAIQNPTEQDDEFDDIMGELDEDDNYLDDPEGIAIPWEEKYGKQANQETKQKDTSKESEEDENKTQQ